MATIGALARVLRTRGLAALRGAAVRFAAATAGTLRIQVRTGQVLLASGQHAFASSGSARVPLRLTRAAKRAIRRAHAAAVEIRASFTPAHGPVVAASTRVRAARRRPTHTIAMR
jgi:hypothetical protein